MTKRLEHPTVDERLAETIHEYYRLCLAAIPAFPGTTMAADDGFGGGLPTITEDGVKRLREIQNAVGEGNKLLIQAEQEAMRFQGYGQILEHHPEGRSATIFFFYQKSCKLA